MVQHHNHIREMMISGLDHEHLVPDSGLCLSGDLALGKLRLPQLVALSFRAVGQDLLEIGVKGVWQGSRVEMNPITFSG